MKKIIKLIVLMQIFFSFSLFAQNNAVAPISKALDYDTVEESISYLKKQIEKTESNCDKRILYAFTASLEEQASLYVDASRNYAKAAGLKVTQEDINSFKLQKNAKPAEKIVYNLLKKTSSILVLDAVRTALNAGEGETAKSYLNSSIRNSKDEKIQAKIKLYEVWASLCGEVKEKDFNSIVYLLKAYANMPEMKSVRVSVLFTLWYINDDAEASNLLRNEYPKSPEAQIVIGHSQIMPTPFWFFVERKGSALVHAVNSDGKNSAEPKASNIEVAKVKSEEPKASESNVEEKIKRQQVGLFGKKENAEALVERLKEKGFIAKIESEKRPSGNTYFIVTVDENKEGNMGLKLKTAGFDCYPIF
ncbi:MAG: SPOR domain-containing protein [Treponema sp.]|nr:SPOR domain-containing protein [Candidatus Treponema scatequi]